MKGIKIGEKESKLPLIQGGMGIGVSLHKLAGTVAAEGGIGIISTADIGFREPDFRNNPNEANIRALKKEIDMARKISNGGIIGVNIMCACSQYDELVQESVKNNVDMIISGAGLPMKLPELVSGSNVKIAPIVSSVRALELICRKWSKKYNRVPDCVIVEGSEAGGHLGFSFDELRNQSSTLENIVSDVISYLNKIGVEKNINIPVIAAGGIYDSNDINRFLKLGASGVQMATRFVATEECDADMLFKQAYIQAKKSDIEIIHSPVGMPGRAIHNSFLSRIEKAKDKAIYCTGCLKACHINEASYCITAALIRSVTGDTDNGLIFCGSNVGRINGITTVKQLLRELFPLQDAVCINH